MTSVDSRPRPTTATRVGRLPLALGALVCAAVLAACGGGDDAATPPPSSTTTSTTSTTAAPTGAVASIMDDLLADEVVVDEVEARCVADALVTDLGEQPALALAANDTDMAALPANEQAALVDSFNDCSSGEAFAVSLLEGFYITAGDEKPAAAIVECVTEQFTGRAGDVLEEMSSPDQEQSISLASLDACVPSEVVSNLLTTSFEAEGAPPALARCIGDRLADEISLAEFAELGMAGGALSPEMEARVGNAVNACAGSGT